MNKQFKGNIILARKNKILKKNHLSQCLKGHFKSFNNP